LEAVFGGRDGRGAREGGSEIGGGAAAAVDMMLQDI